MNVPMESQSCGKVKAPTLLLTFPTERINKDDFKGN